jgi:hypothetical protein
MIAPHQPASVSDAVVQLLSDGDQHLVEARWIGAANSDRADYLITPDGYLQRGTVAA